MNIDYDHSKNMHSLAGARAALTVLFESVKPASLLDVGCGPGTWLRAARELGVVELLGVDGVEVSKEAFLVSKELFLKCDFTKSLQLGRRFDLALCLEVAEHLGAEAAEVLILSLIEHADTVFFSAACPGQPGQHHVNCQWPSYWQEFFNRFGFVCDDKVRWQLWSESRIEPWYRQNIFVARRNPALAGAEPRITSVIHPEMLPHFEWAIKREASDKQLQGIEQGRMQTGWYFKTAAMAAWSKLHRRIE